MCKDKEKISNSYGQSPPLLLYSCIRQSGAAAAAALLCHENDSSCLYLAKGGEYINILHTR